MVGRLAGATSPLDECSMLPRSHQPDDDPSGAHHLAAGAAATPAHQIVRRPDVVPQLLSAAGPERAARLASCAGLTGALVPGTDFTRELQTTADLQIGDTLQERDADGTLAGFALFHTAPLAAGRPQDELRILKLVARDLETFERLLVQAEAAAMSADIRRVSVRCPWQLSGVVRRERSCKKRDSTWLRTRGSTYCPSSVSG